VSSTVEFEVIGKNIGELEQFAEAELLLLCGGREFDYTLDVRSHVESNGEYPNVVLWKARVSGSIERRKNGTGTG